jgi:hypothetical protein
MDVIDTDIIKVFIDDKKEPLRLTCVDTEESLPRCNTIVIKKGLRLDY